MPGKSDPISVVCNDSNWMTVNCNFAEKKLKNFKSIWTKSRRKQATDSIQNSSRKPSHQVKGNWEAVSLGWVQLGRQIASAKINLKLSKAEQAWASEVLKSSRNQKQKAKNKQIWLSLYKQQQQRRSRRRFSAT